MRNNVKKDIKVNREKPSTILKEYGIEFIEISHFGQGRTAWRHIHPDVEFILIENGQFEIETERQRVCAAPGDMLVFRSNTTHIIHEISIGYGNYYVVKLSPAFLFSMFQKSSINFILSFLYPGSSATCLYPAQSLPKQVHQLWQKIITEYVRHVTGEREEFFYAMLRFVVCEFILTCSRYLTLSSSEFQAAEAGLNEQNFRLILDSLNYINENYASQLTAEDCAAVAKLSYSHYAKIFRAVVGKSFKTYLTDLRLLHAYNMLLASATSVSDIALSCGYESFSYFIAEFKKKYGCTPGQMRKRMRDAEVGG